jgi:hypothetical protein
MAEQDFIKWAYYSLLSTLDHPSALPTYDDRVGRTSEKRHHALGLSGLQKCDK